MMKRPLCRFSVLTAGLLLWTGMAQAQPYKLLYDQLKRPANADFYQTPIGLCEDYPEETTTSEIMRGDMELLKRTGVKMLRISFGWDGIETSKDVYDWGFWDDYVKMAVDEYGITLIPYICYTPHWNSTESNPMESWHYPPKDYDEFGQFVFDLVTRYKDRIKSWELWNEPDIGVYWEGSQEEFEKLIQVGSQAVRKADPSATIVLGGLAHDTGWLHQLFKNTKVSDYVDVVNMHNYYETWQYYPVEEMDTYINTIHDIVHRYGKGQPLWMAEVGYSTYRNGSSVSSEYKAYYYYEHTPEFQAVQLVRTIVSALATEKLSALAWYEIKDLPPSEDVIGDNFNNRYLGVAYADFKPKPAEAALTFINKLFSEKARSVDDEVQAYLPLESDIVLHTFEQEDGDVILAGWLRTRIQGEQENVADGSHVDDRRENVQVVIPRSLAGKTVVYDAVGTPTDFKSVKRTGNQTNVDLTLEGGKVYIVHLAKK